MMQPRITILMGTSIRWLYIIFVLFHCPVEKERALNGAFKNPNPNKCTRNELKFAVKIRWLP